MEASADRLLAPAPLDVRWLRASRWMVAFRCAQAMRGAPVIIRCIMMLIAKGGSGMAKDISGFIPAISGKKLISSDPAGAWTLRRRAGSESVAPPACTARPARHARVDLRALTGRRTHREAGHRPRPSGRIFRGKNMVKIGNSL